VKPSRRKLIEQAIAYHPQAIARIVRNLIYRATDWPTLDLFVADLPSIGTLMFTIAGTPIIKLRDLYWIPERLLLDTLRELQRDVWHAGFITEATAIAPAITWVETNAPQARLPVKT
jgi:hypothetical protein